MSAVTHHPACSRRQGYGLCRCHELGRPRTLAGDMERLGDALRDLRQLVVFQVVQLAWKASRSTDGLMLLAAVAIAGLFLGLLVGWLVPA